MRTLSASVFKAQCLTLLDEVERTGEPILVTKRGRVVARVLPAVRDARYPQDTLAGTVEIVGDIVAPAFDEEDWECLR